MNKWIKYFLIIVIIIILMTAFSTSYTSHNLENLAYVVALGIDKADNNKNKLKVTFQFIKIQSSGSDSSSGESDVVIEQVYADSINNAINLMNAYIGKEVNLTHCNVVVFSKELAKEGLYTEIYSLMNNEEVRTNTSIVICTGTANSYLSDSKPNIEKLITRYYNTFSLTSSFTGFSQKISLGEFFNNLKSSVQNSTAILGTLNTTENEDKENTNSPIGIIGGRSTENVGIAVFKNDKFVGELSPIETICHLLIVNDVKKCIISFPFSDINSNIIDLQLSPSRKTKISVDTSHENPIATISIILNANVLTIDNKSDYESSPDLNLISSSAEKYLEKNIKEYLNKITKEYNSDIAGFGRYAISHFWTNSDWDNYKWNDKFNNLDFNINIDVNVSSSLLLTK